MSEMLEKHNQQGEQKHERRPLVEKQKYRSKNEGIKPPSSVIDLQQQPRFPRDASQDTFMKNLTRFMDANNLPPDAFSIVVGQPLHLRRLFKVAGEFGFFHNISKHNAWPRVAQSLGFNVMRSPTAPSQIRNVYEQSLLAYEDAWREQKRSPRVPPGWVEQWDPTHLSYYLVPSSDITEWDQPQMMDAIAQAEHPHLIEEPIAVLNGSPLLETKTPPLPKHKLAQKKLSPADDFIPQVPGSLSITYSGDRPSETIHVGNIPSHWFEEQLKTIFSTLPGCELLWSGPNNLEQTRQEGSGLCLWVKFENTERATSALHYLSGQRLDNSLSLLPKLAGSAREGTPTGKRACELMVNADDGSYRTKRSSPPLDTSKGTGRRATDSNHEHSIALPSSSTTPVAVRNKSKKVSSFPNTTVTTTSGDSGTVCSVVTTTISEIAREIISGICDGIYRDLQLKWSSSNVGAISGNIGELIKAFAMQLGLELTNSMGRTIMYLVHNNHE
jgi:hypothetical protein